MNTYESYYIKGTKSLVPKPCHMGKNIVSQSICHVTTVLGFNPMNWKQSFAIFILGLAQITHSLKSKKPKVTPP